MDFWGFLGNIELILGALLAFASLVVISLSGRLQSWLFGDLGERMKKRSFGFWSRVKNFVIRYRYRLSSSCYYIPTDNLAPLRQVLLKYAYRRNLKDKIIEEIKSNPIKGLEKVGIKTYKVSKEFVKVSGFSKRFSTITNDDSNLKLLAEYNFVSNNHGFVSTIPTRYFFGILRYRKNLYAQYERGVAGAYLHKATKNEANLPDILAGSTDYVISPQSRKRKLRSVMKEVRLLNVAHEAKLMLENKKTSRAKFFTSWEDNDTLVLISHNKGETVVRRRIEAKLVKGFNNTKAKFSAKEKEFLNQVVQDLSNQLSKRTLRRHKLNGDAHPFEFDFQKNLSEALSEMNKKVLVKVETKTDEEPIEGEISKRELRVIRKYGYRGISSVSIETGDLKNKSQHYLNTDNIISIKPHHPESVWDN